MISLFPMIDQNKGVVRDWAKVLKVAYDTGATSLDWYSGSSGFTPTTFSLSLANFANAAESSFTPPTSSGAGGGSGFSDSGSSGGGGGGGSFGGR